MSSVDKQENPKTTLQRLLMYVGDHHSDVAMAAFALQKCM